MVLTAQLSRQVAGAVQRRGRQYYTSGAVEIVGGDERSVRALVQGTEQYQVRLTRERKHLKVWCTCPYYQDRLDPCKHIWATLLAAEDRGLLLGSGSSERLRLIDDEEAFFDWQEQHNWPAAQEKWDDEGEEWADASDSAGSAGRAYAYWQPKPKRGLRRSAKKAARAATWKKRLAGLRGEMQRDEAPGNEPWPARRELVYVVDVAETLESHRLTIEVAYRQRKKDGDWSKPKTQRIPLEQIDKLPDPEDRRLLALLVGAREERRYDCGYSYSYPFYDSAACRYRLTQPMLETLMPGLCRTGRCLLRRSPQDVELSTLQWDEGEPWGFWLRLTRDESGQNYLVQGELRRGEERMALTQPALLVQGGLVFTASRVARLQDFGAFEWIRLLRKQRPLTVPVEQRGELLKELLELPRLPRLDLPEELRFEEVALSPQPLLKVRAPDRYSWGPERLRGELSFAYENEMVPHTKPGRGIYQADRNRLLVRDQNAERAAAERLVQLGFRYSSSPGRHEWQLTPRSLPGVVRALLEAGWQVEAEGKLYHQPGAIHIEVSSGIDWFELHGSVEFGDTEAKLPELLAVLKRGETTVQLDDGTFGMLPEAWLKKYGLLAGLGTPENDHLRFRRSQVGLLDALLASQPEATCDAVFAQARDELRRFEGIEPADPPADFVGQLRGYQREGLGWLNFLQKFGFSGCLADDMGLGKTIQVLALLESRRALKAENASARNGKPHRPGPSLVVVPRSLVFNWKQEAARFTPKLRILDHTGATRSKAGEHFDDYDVILTTYGTLRRDALLFKELHFDYCILDEAQAIKNAGSESAKAARLLKGDYRLALSGTPVENHLGELWSLFEFLNPGMLGSASVFRLGGAGARNPDEETRMLLARALRPFILRRTKDQVAKDLPQKSEQTIYCELESAQRKLYDELREHYRQTLLGRIEQHGINKSKIQILEALLRLRQAACHPGLIDNKKARESSAKLDSLLPQIAQVLDEGHKALVFSQFTSLLAIVRDRLDAEKIPYEYLDGRTRDRASRVERFQNDPECKLFLISLKAGGLGLNLTAAEYVFLLDPWWNPAVEAQAIDRTHRIGQTRPVFAYRLIARDTVEEKVLELQQSKRDLADAIINADNSLIRNLGREDLELLLS
jgi:superfamily II DNA or RNA helicase